MMRQEGIQSILAAAAVTQQATAIRRRVVTYRHRLTTAQAPTQVWVDKHASTQAHGHTSVRTKTRTGMHHIGMTTCTARHARSGTAVESRKRAAHT